MSILRKIVLALGVMLLVGGWGLMQYVGAQQQAIAADSNEVISLWAGESTKVSRWLESNNHMAGKTLSMVGVICMAVGAATTVLTLVGGRRFDGG